MATQAHPLPRLLVVEDDPISSCFLLEALKALPAQVDICSTQSSALKLAMQHQYQLALIDLHLPDGDGPSLLQRLRPLQPHMQALAHTAELESDVHRELSAAGFSQVLIKPISLSDLQTAARNGLARRVSRLPDAGNPDQDWDEVSGLRALNGQKSHLKALRELFLSELPGIRDTVEIALREHDNTTLQHQLHRLQASCGFVGAARLAQATVQLKQSPADQRVREHFRQSLQTLLES